jgi:hypothetical protein
MSLAFSLEGKVWRARPDGDLSGQGCVEERRDPMADFACITRSLKKQFLTPHIRKRKPRTGGCRASQVPFWGTVMGWGCPSPDQNNSLRLREDDRSAVGCSHFVTCQKRPLFLVLGRMSATGT